MLRKKYKPETFVFFVDNDDSYIRDVLAKFEEVNEHNYGFNIGMFNKLVNAIFNWIYNERWTYLPRLL